MIEDNKDLQGLTIAELNQQYIYALRNAESWRKKSAEVKQADSKAVCTREILYWNDRAIAIRRIFSHLD